MDQAQLGLLQVTQAAVDQLRRGRTVAEAKSPLSTSATSGCAGGVERNAGPRDAAADDEQIEKPFGQRSGLSASHGSPRQEALVFLSIQLGNGRD